MMSDWKHYVNLTNVKLKNKWWNRQIESKQTELAIVTAMWCPRQSRAQNNTATLLQSHNGVWLLFFFLCLVKLWAVCKIMIGRFVKVPLKTWFTSRTVFCLDFILKFSNSCATNRKINGSIMFGMVLTKCCFFAEKHLQFSSL